MEVTGSKLAVGVTAGQVYICQRFWGLLVEVFVQRAAEVLFVSSIFVRNFHGREEVGFELSRMSTVMAQLKGPKPRSDEAVEFSPVIEDSTKDAIRPALDVKFIDGPDTSVRVASAIKISVAATSKNGGESEEDKDEDDEDDDNEEDLGEEGGEEDVSSEDAGEENNDGVGDAEGGDEDDDDEDEDEEDANDNNENNGSDDDEDDDDEEDEVVEEEDDHGEGEEGEEDDEGEDEDGKEDEEDEEDEESLHPPKKRKK